MIDTSALAQRGHPDVKARLGSAIGDYAAVCDMVVAESLIRARSAADLTARQEFFDTIDVLAVDEFVWDEVWGMVGLLVDPSRTVATGDMVIAACARLHDLTVLHYDADYDILGEAAGLEHEWVVPSGTL